MTWRRLTHVEAMAEALAEFRERVHSDIEQDRMLRDLFEQDDIRRAAALELTRPLLADMTSSELLDVLHGYYRRAEQPLPCDDQDVFAALLDELDRRRSATAHERVRLRELDRKS